jgi:hypothetical protein
MAAAVCKQYDEIVLNQLSRKEKAAAMSCLPGGTEKDYGRILVDPTFLDSFWHTKPTHKWHTTYTYEDVIQRPADVIESNPLNELGPDDVVLPSNRGSKAIFVKPISDLEYESVLLNCKKDQDGMSPEEYLLQQEATIADLEYANGILLENINKMINYYKDMQKSNDNEQSKVDADAAAKIADMNSAIEFRKKAISDFHSAYLDLVRTKKDFDDATEEKTAAATNLKKKGAKPAGYINKIKRQAFFAAQYIRGLDPAAAAKAAEEAVADSEVVYKEAESAYLEAQENIKKAEPYIPTDYFVSYGDKAAYESVLGRTIVLNETRTSAVTEAEINKKKDAAYSACILSENKHMVAEQDAIKQISASTLISVSFLSDLSNITLQPYLQRQGILRAIVDALQGKTPSLETQFEKEQQYRALHFLASFPTVYSLQNSDIANECKNIDVVKKESLIQKAALSALEPVLETPLKPKTDIILPSFDSFIRAMAEGNKPNAAQSIEAIFVQKAAGW